MNNSQVAHVWAQQKKESGKGSSFYFEGPTIYSYGPHFPIATFIRADVVLFTTNSYSNSTCKHINHASRALSGLPVRVFHVPHVDGRHADNVRAYVDGYTRNLAAAKKARLHKEMHIQSAERAQSECLAYCRTFALDTPAFEAIPDELRAAARVASEKRDAEYAAKREKDNARWERIHAANAMTQAEKIEKWRAGELSELYFDHVTMLRLAGRNVETSRGASVPLADARNLWRMVNHSQLAGQAYMVPPDKAFSVGEFQLREIQADGTCVVGCHTLTFEESRAFATAQGWLL